MIFALLVLVSQDVDELIGRLDKDPLAAEKIIALGEAAREPLRKAGAGAVLRQLELSLKHARFENFAHRLWFGSEAEAFSLLEEVGGLTEKRGKFKSSGARGYLEPPDLDPVLKELVKQFRSGPVARVAARLVYTHRLDDFEPDLLGLLPTDDPTLLKAVIEALGFIGTSRAERLMVPRLRSADADVRGAAHRYIRRTLPEAALPVLVKCIEQGPEDNAVDALRAVIRYADERANDVAVAAIDSDSEPVRRAAVRAVSAMRLPRAADRLRRAIEDPDSDTRLLAIQALVELRDRASAPAMVEALERDPPRAIRTSLATALLEIDPDGQVGRIAPLAGDEDVTVRRNVLISLSRIKHPTATAALLSALKDPDAWNRAIAAEGLTGRDTPEARAGLIAALDDTDNDVVERALLALESIGVPEALPKILELLKSESPGLRSRAGQALQGCVTAEQAGALSKSLETFDHPDARSAVFAALVRAGGAVDPERLRRSLESSSPGVRLQALELAFKLRSPLIEARLDDSDPGVRRHAARALALLGRHDLIPRFVEMLRDPAPSVRQGALEALDFLDARDRRAAIEELLTDEDSRVQNQARRTIEALGGQTEEESITDMLASGSERDKLEALARIQSEGAADAVPEVRDLVDDPSAFVRRGAVETLGILRDEESAGLVAGSLKDEDLSVRAAAIIALARLDPDRAEEAVMQAVDHAAEEIRRAGVSALREFEPERAEPHLLKCMKIPALRASAIDTMALLGIDAHLDQIEHCLGDRSAVVRASAIEALVAMDAKNSAPAIARRLQDRKADVRRAAVRALSRLEAAEFLPQIRVLLEDPAEPALLQAVLAVREFRDTRSVPALRKLLDHPNQITSREAALALLDLGGLEEIDYVMPVLEASTPRWQERILARLSTIESPALKPLMTRLIRNADNPRRVSLIRICGDAALQELEPVLGELLDDPSFVVREEAAESLARLQPSRSTRDRLAKLAESGDLLIKLRAAAALAAGGDRRAIPILREHLGRKVHYRRRVATGLPLTQDFPLTYDRLDIHDAEDEAMIAVNRLRRRAAWLTLAESRIEQETVAATELFPEFEVFYDATAPEDWELASVPLGDLAPKRRTDLQAIHRIPLPGLPIIEAEEILILDRKSVLEFWQDWLEAQD